jgi:hypothetical protein
MVLMDDFSYNFYSWRHLAIVDLLELYNLKKSAVDSDDAWISDRMNGVVRACG